MTTKQFYQQKPKKNLKTRANINFLDDVLNKRETEQDELEKFKLSLNKDTQDEDYHKM